MYRLVIIQNAGEPEPDIARSLPMTWEQAHKALNEEQARNRPGVRVYVDPVDPA
jgi:hypothetical protein